VSEADEARQQPHAGDDEEAPPRRRRLDAVVHGSVQGVGFRYFVLDEASAMRLVGWVANQADGSVRCVAEGPEQDLLRLLRALNEGPRAARVSRVEERWGPATGEFAGFRISSGWHSGD
jgi:acylphosphatase